MKSYRRRGYETDRRISINASLAQYQSAQMQAADEEKALIRLKEDSEHLQQALSTLQAVAEAVQQSAHEQVADIVTRCLRAVFDDFTYEFRIRFEQKRGKTEALLLLVKDGVEYDPVDSCGGGVLDVAAFALRLSCLVLSRPERRKLLVLDEPFRHLSSAYRPAAARVLELLSRELSVQLVMVTHSEELKVGKVIEL